MDIQTLSLVFLVLYTLLLCSPSYCLNCYQCTNMQNASDCNSLTQCNQDELCYTQLTVAGTERRFTMGCRSQQVCQSTATTSVPSLTLIGRDVSNTIGCSRCCNTDTCNTHLCVPVNGKWSPWQHWSNCGVTCGKGTRTRERLCNSPAPTNGGQNCPWNGDETEMCYPSHWSRWSDWGNCSVSCGIGFERRARTCLDSYPGPDGNSCLGDYHEDRACFLSTCSDAQWSSWGDWSSCSVTCNTGIKRRTRTCSNPAPTIGGLQCPGNSEQVDVCNNLDCSITTMTTQTIKTTSQFTTEATTTIQATTTETIVPTLSTKTQTLTPVSTTKTTILAASTTALTPAGYTIPPNPTTCFVCMDDAPDMCDFLYAETTCAPPNNYCINQVTNTVAGVTTINRTCGNFDRCYKDWYLGSSDKSICRTFAENQIYTLAFECVYCCVEDGCNENMRPTRNTLYEDH